MSNPTYEAFHCGFGRKCVKTIAQMPALQCLMLTVYCETTCEFKKHIKPTFNPRGKYSRLKINCSLVVYLNDLRKHMIITGL